MSVLFCDLVGSTTRAESLDPEDVRAALASYHERVRDELERFGGTVEKFIGDAVMAIFGAPIAHEDDPERAIRAALAIRDWAIEEPDVEVRVGVTTGEVLVALEARPELGEAMASGDVVNVAARLQSAAPVNGILVDEATYRASDRAITFRDGGAGHREGQGRAGHGLGGRGGAVAVRRRRHAGAPHGARGPRERAAASARCVRAGAARARAPVRDPGGRAGHRQVADRLSSSRRSSRPTRSSITWRQGRCLPYGDGVSFWALAEMVKAEAGILESDWPRDRCDEALDGGGRPRPRGRRAGSSAGLGPLLGMERRSRPPTAPARRCFRPGGASSKAWPSAARRCSCSRICTGRTRASWTSSTSSRI